jgi:hypothetical protein
MKRPRPVGSIWRTLAIIAAFFSPIAYFPLARIMASPPVTILPSQGKPAVRLQNPRQLEVNHTGPAELVSATCGVQVSWIQCATDGMPLLSTRNNMYHPGGARFGFMGTLAVTTPPVRLLMSRSTRRWLPSKE